MTKAELRAELFRIKERIRYILLDDTFRGIPNTESPLYNDILSLFREMDRHDYC